MSEEKLATDHESFPPSHDPDFRLLFESAPDSYLVLSADFRIVAVSDAYLRATNTKRDVITGRDIFEVFPDNPDDPTATGVRNLKASLHRVIEHRAADAMPVQKYDIRRPDSEGGGFEERYWSPINSPISGPDGTVRHIIHIVEDVTESVRLHQRDAMHEKLVHDLRINSKELETNFRLLVEGTKDYAIYMLDPRGYIATWNAGAERIKGYRAEEIIGTHFSRFYPPDDLQRGKPEDDLKIASTEGRFEEEGQRVRKDGSLFWANVIITALRDDAGNLQGFSKITRDITERKQAETNAHRLLEEETARKAADEYAEALWKQREQLRVTLQSIGDGVITTDSEGRVGLMNLIAEQLTGWTNDEAVGLPLEDVFRIVDEESRRTVENPVVRTLKEGMIVGLANHTLLISKDGTERPIADSAAPIRDEVGNVSGVVLVFQNYTERREAEQRLRDSENRFRAFMDNSPALAWVTDGEGRMLFVGKSYRQTIQLPDGEPIGKSVVELFSPDTAQTYLKNIRSVRDSGQVLDAIELGIRVDGTQGEFRVFKFPLISQGETLVGGVALDVTEERKTREALRSSEERFRLLIDCVKEYAIYTIDPGGSITTWNDGAARIFGYTAEEIIGENPSKLEDVAKLVSLRDFELAEATGFVSEERWRIRKDGSRFWSNGTISVLYDDAGGVRGYVKIVRDLSDRRRAEEALRLRDRAIQSVSQGILITDSTSPDNPIIYASPGFERITGYRADEVIGKNCRFLQGPETNPETVAELRHAIGEGRECSVEILNYRKDGTKFWNAVFVTPLRDEDQRLINFVGVQADVTDRRTLEHAFQQSQKMEAVGQLAGGIAHDFNNLLTVILAYSDLVISDMAENDPKRDLVKAIGEAGQRAALITGQLLAFSRHVVWEPKVLNLNEVVQQTESLLRRLIGEDISLTTVLVPITAKIKVDPGQLTQVLMNLSVNARDAMPKGGDLTIETRIVELSSDDLHHRPEVEPGRYAVLLMSDTGTGMTPDVQARIFEPFFTTKGVGKGTGLGLSVVHGIIKKSGGFVEVDSEVGRGTCFRIFIPAVVDGPPSQENVESATAVRGTETILFVEDEDMLRALAVPILRPHGYTVLVAGNGNEALRVAEGHRIDLLVTDMVMPGMSGPELADAMRYRFPQIKVLFTTGYTEDSVVRHGLSQDVFAFLQKPYTPLSLVRRIRQVLDESA